MFFLKWLVFPLASVLLGVWAKVQARRAGPAPGGGPFLTLQDFAVGLDLFRTSLMALFLFTLQETNQLPAVLEQIRLAYKDNPQVAPVALMVFVRRLSETLNAAVPIVFIMLIVYSLLYVYQIWVLNRNGGALPPLVLLVLLILGLVTTIVIPYLFFDQLGGTELWNQQSKAG